MRLATYIRATLLTYGLIASFTCGAAGHEMDMSTRDSQLAQKLQDFMAKPKFRSPAPSPGMQPFRRNTQDEAKVNQLAQRLLLAIPPSPTKQAVLDEFRYTLQQFDDADSEDSDQLLSYLSELMDIFGIASSDGVLNTWRYGFDPKKTTQQNNEDAIGRMSAQERSIAAMLDALKPESALHKLTAQLGPPSLVSAGTYQWILNTQRQTAVTLSIGPPLSIVGLLRARTYSYLRQLEK